MFYNYKAAGHKKWDLYPEMGQKFRNTSFRKKQNFMEY